ncbi:hypothetical protein [Streptomyces sp. NPDC016172]|uniref:hypothetical protein n=1 Tax=Streptomyces sp. NPDC016172 TaxID=3364964 RepID=UPI0036F4D0E7
MRYGTASTRNWRAPRRTERSYSTQGTSTRWALVRDADKTPWTKEGAHGSASERVEAFTMGQELGVEGCLPQEVSAEGATVLDDDAEQ